MGFRRGDQRAAEWRRAAAGDLYFTPAGQFEHGQGVPGDRLQTGIAGARSDRNQIGFDLGDRVEQGQRVVDPGIDVEDQRDQCGEPIPCRSPVAASSNSALPEKVCSMLESRIARWASTAGRR